jgi:glutamine synthetase adenylyltransferase
VPPRSGRRAANSTGADGVPPTAGSGAVRLEDVCRVLADPEAAVAWGVAAGLAEPQAAQRAIAGFAAGGISLDLVATLVARLAARLPTTPDPDRVLATLERFFAAVRSPLAAAALFDRDPRAFDTLLDIFAASPYLAEIVLADPEAWEEVRRRAGRRDRPATAAGRPAGRPRGRGPGPAPVQAAGDAADRLR